MSRCSSSGSHRTRPEGGAAAAVSGHGLKEEQQRQSQDTAFGLREADDEETSGREWPVKRTSLRAVWSFFLFLMQILLPNVVDDKEFGNEKYYWLEDKENYGSAGPLRCMSD